MSNQMQIYIVACIFLLLVGCGTNVKALLDDESRLYWRADQIVRSAEDLDLGIENAVLDAESTKYEACESVNSATKERIYEGPMSLAQRVLSGLTRFLVRIVPVGMVERCAEAHVSYKRELVALRQRLEQMGVYLPPPE
jgi:hypothetical protein